MNRLSSLLRIGVLGWLVGLVALAGAVLCLVFWPVALAMWVGMRRSGRFRTLLWRRSGGREPSNERQYGGELEWRKEGNADQ